MIGVKAVNEDHEVMLITNEGIIIQISVSNISKIGRITSGVKLIDIDTEKNIKVAKIAKVRENPKGAEGETITLKESENDTDAADNPEDEPPGEDSP